MSGIVNKIKEAVHGDKSHEAPQGSHGPHSSAAANTVDPRVDSDRDHRANPTSTVGGTGAHTGTHTTGTHTGTHTTGAGYGSSGVGASHEAPQGTHGPHSSKIANTVDPRVDSDRDHRANPTSSTIGGTGAHATGAHTGTHTGAHTGTHTTGAGYGSSGLGASHEAPQGTHGPHGSKMANTVDPRVDSDRDHRANPASNVGGTHNTSGAYGSTGHSTGHSTGTSGLTGSTGTTGTHGVGHHAGPGPAPNTAGPHKSDMLNKADPRVDSNLDGSKTVGGDKTFQS